MPIPFYKINPDSYLFSKKITERDGDFEEPIRQWYISELQSAYGICITNIEVEFPCKVGSKSYHADILVRKGGKPHILVECKKTSFQKHEQAIAQAVSYADSAGVKAEFCVYTNGVNWVVCRRYNGGWARVPDLPIFIGRSTSVDICHAMRIVRDLWPILYFVMNPVSPDRAREYLSAWQRLFYGGNNLLTSLNNFELLVAAENFFRVASSTDVRDPYLFEKMHAGCVRMKEFFNLRELGFHAHRSIGKVDLSDSAKEVENELFLMIEHADGIEHPDILLLRMLLTLMKYIQECLRLKPGRFLGRDKYAPIPQDFQNEAIGFLKCVLRLNLNWSLPDVNDDIRWSDIKSYSEYLADSYWV
jgi:hypothetical protein